MTHFISSLTYHMYVISSNNSPEKTWYWLTRTYTQLEQVIMQGRASGWTHLILKIFVLDLVSIKYEPEPGFMVIYMFLQPLQPPLHNGFKISLGCVNNKFL